MPACSLARERELHGGGGVNVDYLKSVVVGYVSAPSEADKATLLSVLATMLHFTPEEAAKARALHSAAHHHAGSRGKGGGGVTGWLSATIGAVAGAATGGGAGGAGGGER